MGTPAPTWRDHESTDHELVREGVVRIVGVRASTPPEVVVALEHDLPEVFAMSLGSTRRLSRPRCQPSHQSPLGSVGMMLILCP